MDKASGVYYTITDNSQGVAGASGLVAVVAMLTKKGDIKHFNKVNAQNFKDVLGYDLVYNPNFLGLSKILEKFSYVYVMRLNQGALHANVYFQTLAADPAALTECTDPLQLAALNPAVWVAHKDAGNWGNFAVRFAPQFVTKQIPNVAGTYTLDVPATAQIADLLEAKLTTTDGLTVLAESVLDGTRVNFVDPSDPTVIYGTLEEGASEIVINLPAGSRSNIAVKYVDNSYKNWTLSYYSVSGTAYSLVSSYDFSIDSEDTAHFWQYQDFGDLQIGINSLTYAVNRGYIPLGEGSNGDSNIVASDIDWSDFNKKAFKCVCLNGIVDISIINAFCRKGESKRTPILHDFPDFTKYEDVSDWATNLYPTEFRQGVWITDNEKTSVGTLKIYGSVNLLLVYANMFETYGSGRYPAAGYTYGPISVTELTETDYADYRDELKTQRINYQMADSQGTFIWEQRTGYADGTSDLSYANSVWILNDLIEQLVETEKPFNFRYSSPEDLITQESNLKTLLDDYKSKRFLYKYDLVVPTYEQAQEAGRTLTIRVGVSIGKDAEVIWLDIVLNK